MKKSVLILASTLTMGITGTVIGIAYDLNFNNDYIPVTPFLGFFGGLFGLGLAPALMCCNAVMDHCYNRGNENQNQMRLRFRNH